MIEAIFVVSIVVYLACRQHERRQQQLTHYVQQRHYIMRETIVHLPNGGQAVHRELEWIE